MKKKSLKNLMVLVLSVLLAAGAVVTGSCVGKAQIIESITPQEAFALIQENQDNPDFVIIDVRTPEEFADEHLENAIQIDYNSETFQDELNILDKNKAYLIYCRTGGRSECALDMMAELDFREVYNMSGGLTEWVAAGLPTAQETPTQITESITPQEAFALIQENQDNPDFVIIDVQRREEFVKGHIEDAINIDYDSETFRDELNKLDKNKTYLIYYGCSCGGIDRKAVNMMAELDFREVYKMSGGLQWWKEKELPTAQETPTQITESITPQEAFTLVKENQGNPDFVIIDLRTPEEFAYEHIENAINIDLDSEIFRDELSQLDKNKAYLIYSVSACGNGPGWNALAIMEELDFWEVYNMTGGCIGWKLEGFPTVGEGANQ